MKKAALLLFLLLSGCELTTAAASDGKQHTNTFIVIGAMVLTFLVVGFIVAIIRLEYQIRSTRGMSQQVLYDECLWTRNRDGFSPRYSPANMYAREYVRRYGANW